MKIDRDPRIQMDSLYFTSPVLEDDMSKHFREHQATIEKLAGEILRAGRPQLYFLGGGASLSAMMSAEYLLNRFTDIPARALNGVEFLSLAPETVGKNTFIVLTSWSGESPELLTAQQYAKSRGAMTIAITKHDSTPLAAEVDLVIPCPSKAVYVIPQQIVYLLSACLIRGGKLAPAVGDKLLDDLAKLPKKLGAFVWEAEEIGKKAAAQFKDVKGIYVVAGGSQYGLGYKLALSVIIENLWINASIINGGEFYHGPIEIIDNGQPPFLFLVGKDASRDHILRAIQFVQKKDIPHLVFDAADYPMENELLAPFYLFVATEWFIMYMSAQRDHDVDERRYMGKVGARWGEF